MNKKILPLIFLIIFFIASWSEARVYLDINSPTFVQIPIVLPKWKAVGKTPPNVAERIYETVSNDLTLSGFFKVITYPTLPPSLQRKEGIPSTVVLQEWTAGGGEILLAGEVSVNSDPLDIAVTFHLFDLVEEKPLVGKQYEGSVQLIRHMAHRIADEVVLQLTGERGVHTTKVAYVLVQGEGKEIAIADFDGANVRPITQNQSINISPAWAPDGKKIAFTSYLKRNPDLYLIDLDGKALQRFSYHPGVNASPSWAPDGKEIALMMGMDGKSEIALIDADGKNPKKLTQSHGNEASPSWSPDGKRIAFVSDRSGSPQIYVMGRDGSNVRRLTFEGNYNTNPAWSPKGDQIAFCGRAGGRFEVFVIRPEGTGLQRLTSNSGQNEKPSWSPDGRYIAFSSTQTGGSKIFIMNSNGFNPRPLTTSKGGELSPAISRRFD
jgi:TolB protein